MTTVIKDIVGWLQQWYYTEDEIDTKLANKLNSNLTESNRIVKTDDSGNVTVGNALSNYENPVIVDNLTTNDATKVLSAKQGKVLQDNKLEKVHSSYKGKNVVTNASTGAIEFENKVTDVSQLTDNNNTAFTPKSHNQASSTITDTNTYSNIGNSAQTQQSINDAINTVLGTLLSMSFLVFTTNKGDATSDKMGKLYVVNENSKVNFYYVEDKGASANPRYAWHKMDADMLDELTVSWNDVQNKPSSFTPSSHTQGTPTISLTTAESNYFTTLSSSASTQEDLNKDIDDVVTAKSDKTATLGTTITLVDKGETNEGCIIFNTIS